MPAIRKLDWAAVEQIVTARAAGRSLRQVAAALGVSHSTVSRRIRRDPELRARIRAAKKREARRARDRERKTGAKARREAGLEPGSRPEQGQRSGATHSPGTRPHGRRDELRAARRILLDLTASFEAREVARETLLELHEATRSNGRPAYSLRHAAAKAITNRSEISSNSDAPAVRAFSGTSRAAVRMRSRSEWATSATV